MGKETKDMHVLYDWLCACICNFYFTVFFSFFLFFCTTLQQHIIFLTPAAVY